MRSELGERRMNPLSPVSFFGHTKCGQTASAELNLSFYQFCEAEYLLREFSLKLEEPSSKYI